MLRDWSGTFSDWVNTLIRLKSDTRSRFPLPLLSQWWDDLVTSVRGAEIVLHLLQKKKLRFQDQLHINSSLTTPTFSYISPFISLYSFSYRIMLRSNFCHQHRCQSLLPISLPTQCIHCKLLEIKAAAVYLKHLSPLTLEWMLRSAQKKAGSLVTVQWFQKASRNIVYRTVFLISVCLWCHVTAYQ